MRALIAMIAAVAMVVAQVPAFAEVASPVPQVAAQNSAIATAFKAFPSGGEPLQHADCGTHYRQSQACGRTGRLYAKRAGFEPGAEGSRGTWTCGGSGSVGD